MLLAMRNSTRNWLAKVLVGVLFILLALSFVLWGVEDVFLGSNQEKVIGQVGDVEISAQEFSAQYYRQTLEIKRLLGDAFNAERGREMGYVSQVLVSLVNRALFQNAADDLGLTVSDSFVKQRILDDDAFHDDFGQFSEIIFREALYESGYTEESYVQGTRQDLIREQLVDIFQRIPSPPEVILDPLVKLYRERRGANVIMIDLDSVEGFNEPNEEELEKYFSTHAEDFQSPELRDISYVHVQTTDVIDQIDVAEETLREFYDDRIDSFTQPERRNLRQILVKDRLDAEKAKAKLDQGEDFVAVAKEVANLEEEDINLGWNERNTLLEVLVEPVFDTESTAAIGPLESPFGWHILQVMAIEEEFITPFEEAKKALRNQYAGREALEVLYEMINQSEDMLAGGATLEELATTLNLDTETVEGISANGETVTGVKREGVPPSPFLERAFREEPGSISETIESGDDGFMVIRVEQLYEPRPLSFAEAKDQVKQAWISDQKRQTARETADFIAEEINQGKNIETLAQNYGFEVVGRPPFFRDDLASAELPPPLIAELFTLEPGQAVVGEDNQVFIVAQLADIVPVSDEPQENEDRAEVAARLRSDLASDFLSQYSAILRERYAIDVYDNVIDSLL